MTNHPFLLREPAVAGAYDSSPSLSSNKDITLSNDINIDLCLQHGVFYNGVKKTKMCVFALYSGGGYAVSPPFTYDNQRTCNKSITDKTPI